MAKSNWAYEILLDTFKQYYEKNPVSILTKAKEAIKELQESQQKELTVLKKGIKSGQLDSVNFKSEANQGLGESQTNESITTNQITIKLEKVSLAPSQEDSEKENINVINEDMPAPTWVPPVKKKTIKTERVSSTRSTRTKSKKQSTVRDSDVILQTVPVPVVNLIEENGEESEAKTTRSTRSKVRKNAEAVKDVDVETSRTTRTKTRAATKNVIEKSDVEVGQECVAEVAETRSTRTKTIRKGKPVEDVAEPEPETEVRTTRTKTIRKAKNTEDVNATTMNATEASNVEEVVRSTRSKAVKKIKDHNTTVTVPEKQTEEKLEIKDVKTKSKRSQSVSDDDEEIQDKKAKKSKSNSPQAVANSTMQTVYEDARSSIDDVPVGCQQETVPANSTFVLPKNNILETERNAKEEQLHQFDNNGQCDLFTDDDSTNEVKTPPPSKKAFIKHQPTKEVFSPYEKTTLKKKVEAFEKLQSGTDHSAKTGGSKLPQLINSGVKEKTKLFTPVASKITTLNSISTSKINKFFPQQSRDSSQTKSCQRDPREYARKQMEREQAQKKKEALLAYQSEQRRKLNEERKLKALQQRKALEEEKAKLLEIQKSKQEKLKQRELEREENHRKYVQEQERKRAEQKKRLLEAQKQAIGNKPLYMTSKPPMLADDDYDSDDSNYRKVKAPSWCTDKTSKLLQLCMMSAGQKIKNTLFCPKPDTVNLVEIFETIDERKLKRTSSAIWRVPPRYTMMPDDLLNKTKFSDDEDL